MRANAALLHNVPAAADMQYNEGDFLLAKYENRDTWQVTERQCASTHKRSCSSTARSGIRAFRAVLLELKMYADEWPEVVNLGQSVLNNSLSTRLNKRTPM
jgi:hypothetical protein